MKTIVKTGFKGVEQSIDKYANSPVALSKLERDKASFSKIKNLDAIKGYKGQK